MKASDNQQIPDNHHFVSQFYLRRFASNPKASKSKKRIYAYDRDSSEWSEPKKIKDVAAESKFHTIGGYSGIETAFANAETDFSDASTVVIKRDGFGTNEDNIATTRKTLIHMAYFIALQYFKTPHARQQIRQQIRNVNDLSNPQSIFWQQYLYAAFVEYRLRFSHEVILQASKEKKPDTDKYLLTIEELNNQFRPLEEGFLRSDFSELFKSGLYNDSEFVKRFHLRLLLGFSRNLVFKMLNMHWLILQRTEDFPILTSDHPTKVLKNENGLLEGKLTYFNAMRQLEGSIDFDVKAYNEDDYLILFPLSPNRLIMLMGRNLLKQQEKLIISPGSFQVKVFTDLNNYLQFNHSTTNVYSNKPIEFPKEYYAVDLVKSFLKGLKI